jgi:adenylate kinase
MRCLLVALMLLAMPAWAQAPGRGLVMVLIGPPGSGKTTQAEFIRRRYTVPVIAVDELRKQAGASGDKLNGLVRARAAKADASKGFVLDGYPATHAEADFLQALVTELKLPPPIILQLDIPDDVCRERLAKRDGKKYDAAAVDERIAAYHKEMDLIRSYYPKGDIWTLIGTKPPREVFETVVALVQDRE